MRAGSGKAQSAGWPDLRGDDRGGRRHGLARHSRDHPEGDRKRLVHHHRGGRRALVNRDSIAAIKAVLLPAVLSGILIIVAGIAIAYLLRVMGIAPPDDILATSPGALSSVSAVAVERGVGPVEVAVFHLVRLILVILSLPALGLLLDSSG